MEKQIKIAIAEDFELERHGLIGLLEKYDDIEVVLSVANGKELLEGLKSVKPDIVLLDIQMAVMGGREAFERITLLFPDLKVIMLTEHFTDTYVREFIKKGANAFLSKNNKIERVVETIRKVHKDGKCYDNVVAKIISENGTHEFTETTIEERPDLHLTLREIEMIRLMCLGKESRDIAVLMHIDIRTVETHRRNIWKKTQIKRNIPNLIEYAFKNNLISI